MIPLAFVGWFFVVVILVIVLAIVGLIHLLTGR